MEHSDPECTADDLPDRFTQETLPQFLLDAVDLIPADGVDALPPARDGAINTDWGDAACQEHYTEAFFPYPETGEYLVPGIRAVCATCPVQTKCMVQALKAEAWGLWCLTETERAALGGVTTDPRLRERNRSHYVVTALNAGVDPYNLADALNQVFSAGGNRVDVECAPSAA